MLDAAHSNQPECHSALIAYELSRLNVDIAALSEVCFPGEGSLHEHGAIDTLFWLGKPKIEGHLLSVDFMVITFRLENLPTGHSNCMMSMCFPKKNKWYAMLFSVYTPTLQAEPAEKDKFYSELRSCLQSTLADNKVIILGKFNAKVGQDADS